MQTKQQTLTLTDGCELRYSPLPALDVADYLEEHVNRFSSTGVFDDLLISGRGVSLDKGKFDLETLAVLGSSLASLLTGGDTKKSLRMHITEHCALFKVQAVAGAGVGVGVGAVDLFGANAEEALNAHLDFGQMSELVLTLAKGVIGPLFGRLSSAAAARQPESAKPSATPSPTS